MKNKTLLMIVAAVAVIAFVCVQAFSKPQQNTRTTPRRVNSSVLGASIPIPTPKGASSSAKNAIGKLPLRFEKNQGQSDPQVQYIAKGGGYTLFLTSTEAVFRLDPPHSNPLKARQAGRNRSRKTLAKQVQKASFVRMKLSGANITPKIEASNLLPGTVNYLIGNDPRKWHTKVPTFGTVQLSGVYPGIDLVYYGNQRQLEYDFVVNPGGDPGNIAFEFEGAMDVALSSSGDLSLDSPAGKITARKPSLYQVVNGQRTAVEGAFVARQGRKFGVEVTNYDHTKPLVIDPVLVYSSYLSGSGDGDLAMGVAVDSQGCAYITGFGYAVDFPTVGTSLSAAPPTGNLLAFVSKLNQNGTELVYSTYLGGTTMDATTAIAVDWKGQAYVVGATVSVDFPVTPVNAVQVSLGPGATWNAFLAKLTADGQSLLYSTYLGGAGDDEAMGVAVDANENAFVTGYASSSGFPVTTGNAFQPLLNSVNGNAFVTRIDTTQGGTSSLVYSTFLGGSSPYSFNDLPYGDFGGDAALGIAIDSNQNAYVVGEASSTDFPITSGKAYQTTGNAHNSAFLARLDTNQAGANSLVYSTFLGGTGSRGDVGYGIALDRSANAYITGCALSFDFPVTIGGSNSDAGKAFVARFNTNLAGTGSLSYSTLVGGSGGDCGYAIAVDPDGDAYVGGFAESSDFPVTANAVQLSLASGSANGVVFALSPDGSNLIYGTYFGGSSGVYSVALDSSSNLYFAGSTTSADVPTTQGAFQRSFQGSLYGFDGFVAEVSGIVTTPQISSIFPSAGGIGSSVIITGSSFGNSQGQGKVTFNGIVAAVSSWSNGSITAKAPSGLSLGTATVVVAGNSVTSNGVSYTVTNPLFMTPGQMTMLVGQSRPIQVLDQNGAPISNPTWTITASAVAEIVAPTNQGDPILLQADSPGTAILSASGDGRSGTAQVTVLLAGSSFPIGSVQWSVPSLGSFGISNSVQALRVDDNTPDLYIEDDGALGGTGAIRGMTADGQQKWIWPSSPQDKFPLLLAADDQGGAIYFASQDIPNQFQSYCYFGRVDENGTESWQYQETNCFEDYAVGADGTIYLMEDDFQNNGTNVLTALDPTTGQTKFTIPLPGVDQAITNNVTFMPAPGNPDSNLPYCTPGNAGGPISSSIATSHGTMSISSDGTLYLPLSGVSTVFDGMPCDSSPDPNNPGYTHVVDTSVASWTATANLYLMAVNPDGTHSIQTVDNRSRAGTNWSNASGPEYNIFAQRPTPDGQGGELLPVEQAVYHVFSSGTSKFSLPITVGSNDLLLGEDGTAYLSGTSQNSSVPDTLLALDTGNGAVKWTTSPGRSPLPGTIMSDGSAAFQYMQSDFTLHLAIADPTGQVSPLFANPNDGVDVGPVIHLRYGARGASYWTLANWFAYMNDGGLAAITGQVSGLSGSPYTEDQGNRQAQHGAQNLVTATFLARVPGQSSNNHPWGVESETRAELLGQISTVAKSHPFYSVTQNPTATTEAFIAENGNQPMDVVGFIGDSDLLSCSPPADPSCFFSVGLIFADRYLIRTPNCDSGVVQSLCYNLDLTYPNTNPPCNNNQIEVNGKCFSSLLPPCGPGATQLGSYCFRFPVPQSGLPPSLGDVLLTSSKVIFVASCDITDVFTGWWEMNLNAVPGGRALVVPDLAAMKSLQINQTLPPQNKGLVDLVQGAAGYEAFVKKFGTAKTAQESVDAANQAIANLYPGLDYSTSPVGPLPQVVYKVVGNPKVCVNCGGNP